MSNLVTKHVDGLAGWRKRATALLWLLCALSERQSEFVSSEKRVVDLYPATWYENRGVPGRTFP